MAKKKSRNSLGKGLDALLGEAEAQNWRNEQPQEGAATGIRMIPVEQIRAGSMQPRTHFDQENLKELADSIRQQGLIQPVVVRSAAGGYELIAGERRWRAAKLAKLKEIPALLREADPSQAMILALVENLQREDLNPLEKAQGLLVLQEKHGLSQQQVADAIGASRVNVTNLLRLLRLEPEVRGLLKEGRLEFGHGRALVALSPGQQRRIAQDIVARGLSVRQTEEMVRQQQSGTVKERSAPPQDANIQALQRKLSDRVGARTLIHHRASGSGRLVFQYNSLEELDGIIARIQ